VDTAGVAGAGVLGWGLRGMFETTDGQWLFPCSVSTLMRREGVLGTGPRLWLAGCGLLMRRFISSRHWRGGPCEVSRSSAMGRLVGRAERTAASLSRWDRSAR